MSSLRFADVCRKDSEFQKSWSADCVLGKTLKGKTSNKAEAFTLDSESFVLAYTRRGLELLAGLQAQSARDFSSSWALFRGISIQDICVAASCSSPFTFSRFYSLYVTAPSLAHSVLNVGMTGGRDLVWGRPTVAAGSYKRLYSNPGVSISHSETQNISYERELKVICITLVLWVAWMRVSPDHPPCWYEERKRWTTIFF